MDERERERDLANPMDGHVEHMEDGVSRASIGTKVARVFLTYMRYHFRQAHEPSIAYF